MRLFYLKAPCGPGLGIDFIHCFGVALYFEIQSCGCHNVCAVLGCFRTSLYLGGCRPTTEAQ